MALRAYCAGIVDGEAYIGCVRLMPTPANKMTSPKYSIRIAIAMCDLEPVEAVASLLSIEDRIFIRNRRSKPHHSQVFVLEIREQNAITLLRMVMPFLRGKKQQAQTMCEFYAFKKTSRKYRTKTGRTLKFKGGRQVGKSYTTRCLSDSYLKKCDAYYMALRRRFVANNGHVARSYR
jgi:hypothetical protein